MDAGSRALNRLIIGQSWRRLAPALALALAACTAPVYEPAPAPPVARPAPPPVEQPREQGEQPELPEPVPAPPPPIPEPIPPPAPPASAGATGALLQQSRQQAASGNYALATSSLERALRINPRDPDLWCELGAVKLRQGDTRQAESMARRGLAVVGGNAAARSRCEALVAEAQGG